MSDVKGAYLLNELGNVVKVPAAAVQENLAAGWTPASPEQAKDFELSQKYSGLGQGAAAFGEGALGALAPGLGVASEIGLGANPEDIAGREHYRSGLHAAGVVTGIAGPTIASMGANLLPESAVAGTTEAATALAAPAFISRAGAATARGVESLLPKATTALGRAGTKALSYGASGALEGALYGGGQVLNEAALGDPNLTSERALEEVGLSSALGGGFGAAIGFGAGALPGAIQKAREAVGSGYKKLISGAESLYGNASGMTGVEGNTAQFMVHNAPAVAQLDGAIPGTAETMSHATPEMAKWMVDNGPKLGEFEKAFPGTMEKLSRVDPATADGLLNNWQKIVTDPQARISMARDFREGAQQVLDTANSLSKRLNTEFVPGEEEQLLGAVKFAKKDAAKEAYAGLVDRVDEAAQMMRAKGEQFSPAHASALEDIASGLRRDLSDVTGKEAKAGLTMADDPVDVFRRLKTLRQQIGDITQWSSQPGDLIGKNTGKLLKGLYHDVGDTLKNPDVFGELASRRAALDEAHREWLSLTGKKGDFYKSFMDSEGAIKSTKVDTWINALAKDKGQEAATHWGRFMDAAKRLVDEAEASSKSAMVSDFDRSAADELFNKTAARAAEVRQSGEATAQYKYLQSGGVGIPNSGPVAPGMLQKAAEFAAPKAVVNTFKAVASVPRAVKALAWLQKTSSAVGARVDSLAAALVSPGAAKVANEAIGEAAGLSAEHIRHMVATPDMMAGKLDGMVDGLHEHAPDTASAIQASAARQLAYLNSVLPQSKKLGPIGPTLTPSKDALFKYNQIQSAVLRPTSILHHARIGTLTPSMVQAVRATSPAMLQHMQRAVMEKLTDKDVKVPYKQRLGLSTLFGQPMDGTTAPQSIQSAQLAYALPSAKSPESQPGGGKSTQTGLGKLNLAGNMRLPGQAAESRRRSENA